MDFLDPKKQRRNTIQLFAGYFLVTVAVVLATIMLVYYTRGTELTSNGKVVQKGIVFVSSQPSGADLYLSGKRIDTTNTKLNLDAGDYSMDIQRNGYRAWHRSITVASESVQHYDYPFLFPTDLSTKAVKTYDTVPSLVTQSPDRRWLVALTDPAAATFDVMDLNNNQTDIKTTTQFSVPASLLAASTTAPRWEVAEWSNNNRHILFKRYYTPAKGQPETFEYILADRQRPDGSHNLSKELGVTPTTELTLRNKLPDSYYLYDAAAQTLSAASLNQPVPVIEVNGVLAYKTHGNGTIVYITKEKAKPGEVTVNFRQNDKDFPVRTLPESSIGYVLDEAQYSGSWYVVMGSKASDKVFIYKNPNVDLHNNAVSGAVFALRIDKPTYVSFSANAQFILAQNGSALRVYDIENKKGYHYDLPFPMDAPQLKVEWMDGDRLTYVSGGKQVVFDYDSLNKQQLVSSDPAFPALFDRQYKYLYSFTKDAANPNGLTVSATPLRTPGDL